MVEHLSSLHETLEPISIIEKAETQRGKWFGKNYALSFGIFPN